MGIKMSRSTQVSLALVIFFILLGNISIAVNNNLKPVLYGQFFNGNLNADGSTVTVYPQNAPSDNLTDFVGQNGSMNLSTYWSINLNNLNTNIQNGNIIVVQISNGVSTTTRFYTVNLNDGTVNLSMNYNPLFQDYDNDHSFANVDCNDNNPAINPSATDTCGDGIDQDCSGSDESCPSPAPSSTGGGGGGGGGGGSGGGCTNNWQCTAWSACASNGQQTRSCSNSGTCLGDFGKPAETQSCNYSAPSTQGTSSLSQAEKTESTTSGSSGGASAPSAGNAAPQGVIPPEPAAPTGFAAITGNAISALTSTGGLTAIFLIVLIALILIAAYYYMRKKKKDSEL